MSDKLNLWVARCALPGLNIMLYIVKPTKPTRADVDKVWMRGNPGGSPLVWDCEGLPLRDCYPGCVGVEKLDVTVLA